MVLPTVQGCPVSCGAELGGAAAPTKTEVHLLMSKTLMSVLLFVGGRSTFGYMSLIAGQWVIVIWKSDSNIGNYAHRVLRWRYPSWGTTH